MATGSLDANGIWQYGEDDSNTTFSALLNRLASSVSTKVGTIVSSISAITGYSRRPVRIDYVGPLANFATSSTSFVTLTGSTKSFTVASTSNRVIAQVNFNWVSPSTSCYAAACLYVNGVKYGENYFKLADGTVYTTATFMTTLTPPATTANYEIRVLSSNGASITFFQSILQLTEVQA